jgi:hypothetical protein
LGAVTDSQLTSAGPIGTLIVGSWTDSDPTVDMITAPTIALLRSLGVFGASLNLTGDLRTAVIAGAIAGGTWTVGGSSTTIVAASTASTWSSTFGGSGVGTFVATGSFSGSLTAPSIKVLRVGRDLSAATITATAGDGPPSPSIGTLLVGGTDSQSHVTTAGSINTVSVGAITGSTVEAGVASTVTSLPTDASVFQTAATIGTFAVTGVVPGTFAVTDAIVAAADLGRAIVRRVNTDNGGTPFGFASQSLALFVDLELGKVPLVVRHPTTSPTTAGDLRVSLV